MIAGAALNIPSPSEIQDFLYCLGAVGFLIVVVIAFYAGKRS
jgi:hypothetical protein